MRKKLPTRLSRKLSRRLKNLQLIAQQTNKMKENIKIIKALSYTLIVLAMVGYLFFPELRPLMVLALVSDAALMTKLFGSWLDDWD